MTTFKTGAALVAGFGFIIPGWRAAWGALALVAVSNAALNLTRIATPTSSLLAWVIWFGQLGLLLLAVTPAHGALARLGLKDRHPFDTAFQPGFGGLQWSRIENRLFAATLAYNLVFYAAFEAMQSLSLWPGLSPHFFAGGGVTVLAGLIWLTFVAIWVWIALRIMAFLPATVEWKRIVLFGAWPLTRKRVWALLPAFLIGFSAQIVPALALAPITAAIGASLSPAGLGATTITFAAGLVIGLTRAIALPFSMGAAIYAYRTAVASPEPAAMFD